MKLTVHDVGLGQFVSLIHESGLCYLWDAGSSDAFSPAAFCRQNGIKEVRRLTITNFDQDHVSGLPELRSTVRIRSLRRNSKADADYIRNLKLEAGPITDAMRSALEMHENWVHPVSPEISQEPTDVKSTVYSCPVTETTKDTNNLSLLTILECGGVKFVISGDLERNGWQYLIENTNILTALRGTNVFVASHHGRESGYHELALDAASPSCVVMSDYEVKHATQQTLDLYRSHCSGVQFNGSTRRVLTTRSDGSISWTI